MRNRFLMPLSILLCSLLLAACGQKGPLYLPKQDPVPAADTASDPAPDDETAQKAD